MTSESDNYQTFGSFGVVNGVAVKISDRFLPPPKITLPSGWKDIDPSELLSFEYDFSRERNALEQAEEERQIRERQQQQREEEQKRIEEEQERLSKEQEEQERLLKEQEEKQRNEELERLKRLRAVEEENEATKTSTNMNGNLKNTATIATRSTASSVNTSTVDILTPLVVTNSSAVQKHPQQSHMFDPLEFENQNDNPFEVVERATLNEYDELRSVLEPGAANVVVRSVPAAASKNNDKQDDFELSSIFFNAIPPVEDANTANIISITDDTTNVRDQDSPDHDYTNEGFDNVPHQPSKGTLTWTNFGSDNIDSQQQQQQQQQQHVVHPFNPLNPFHPNFQSLDVTKEAAAYSSNNNPNLLSKTPPPTVGHRSMAVDSIDGSGTYSTGGPTAIPRTKSMPNLVEQNNDYENAGSISFLNSDSGQGYGVMFSNSQQEVSPSQLPPHQTVPTTNRIENIMKQYQFQRMSGVSSSPGQTPVNNSSTTTVNSTSNGQNMQVENNTEPGLNYHPATNPFGVSSANNYVPPYMVATSNSPAPANYLTYSQPSERSLPPYPPGGHDSYGGGGPMLIHSRPTSNIHPSNLPSDSIISFNPVSIDSQMNLSSRHALPPINNTNTSNTVYSVPSFGSTPPPPPVPYPRQPIERKLPATSEPTVPPRRPQSSKLADMDLKTSPVAPLPNITTPPSFLQDPYTSLSTSEKNFANQLNAMGFPLPCIARAIKRLGMDEKEVLDFLVLVEEMKEITHQDGDDIETALQNNEGDKVKATAYLEMVAMFKELGFQRKNIHDALHETSCDQNKALDYLTR